MSKKNLLLTTIFNCIKRKQVNEYLKRVMLALVYKFVFIYYMNKNKFDLIIIFIIPLSLRMCIIADLQALWLAGLLISEPSNELSSNSGDIQYPSFIQTIAEALISESSFSSDLSSSDTSFNAGLDTNLSSFVDSDLYILGTDLISQTENDIEIARTKRVITLVGLRECINTTVINTFEKIYPLFPKNDEQLDDLNHPFNKLLLNISELAENSLNVKQKIYWDLITIIYAYGTAELENITPDSIMRSSKSFEQLQSLLKEKLLSP